MLDYARAGNLQALLDEYAHQLWEQGGWQNEKRDKAVADMAGEIAYAATIKTSRVAADVFRVKDGRVDHNRFNVRTSYALRYGQLASDDVQHQARENAVRVAFNSPFHPFALITTSIGQEGLDFHPWCHAVYHWNLPGNPVDLEQREGRVHRYKGHAVRKNVADRLGLAALNGRWEPGSDPWNRMFEIAAEACGQGDGELSPYWLFAGPYKVERRVPLLPYSREVERLKRLKRDLVSYRLVFGQPRQQELLEAIRESGIPPEEMNEWMLDLRPGN